MARTKFVNGRDLVYLTATDRGTRLIGGSVNYLAEAHRYVIYHSPFPVLRISFSPFPEGDLRSTITRRKSTWQSTLPTTRLGFPSGFQVSAEGSLQKVQFDDDGAITVDLLDTRRAAREIPLSSADPLDEARYLLERLGALIVDDDELADRIASELGLRLSFVSDSGA